MDEASQQRIKVLEQLMGVYRDLEAVPATLESAYQERKEFAGGERRGAVGPENQRGVSPR